MNIEYFKSKLTKGQIEAMAIDYSKNIMETDDPVKAHIALKRAKFFIDTLIKENQSNALLTWEQVRTDFPNITHTNGKKTYEFKHIPVFVEMDGYLKDIKDCAKKAIESKTPVLYVHPFTGETIVIEKATYKESGETLNVKL